MVTEITATTMEFLQLFTLKFWREKVNLQSIFKNETSEKLHKSIFKVRILVKNVMSLEFEKYIIENNVRMKSKMKNIWIFFKIQENNFPYKVLSKIIGRPEDMQVVH